MWKMWRGNWGYGVQLGMVVGGKLLKVIFGEKNAKIGEKYMSYW